MTEEQAKEKWCPFARIINIRDTVAFNRSSADAPTGAARCIASGCACWVSMDEYDDNAEPQPGGHCGLIKS